MWLAASDAAAAPGIEGYLVTYGPLVLMFVVLYFLLIRPQQKRQKARNMMLSNLKKKGTRSLPLEVCMVRLSN